MLVKRATTLKKKVGKKTLNNIKEIKILTKLVQEKCVFAKEKVTFREILGRDATL